MRESHERKAEYVAGRLSICAAKVAIIQLGNQPKSASLPHSVATWEDNFVS